MSRLKTKKLLIIFLMVQAFLHGIPSFSQETECDVTARWTPPTTGTPVHHYLVDADINDQGFTRINSSCTDTFWVFTLATDTTIRVRVAGVDSENRMGPFSETSLTKTVQCAQPTGPGKPITPWPVNENE